MSLARWHHCPDCGIERPVSKDGRLRAHFLHQRQPCPGNYAAVADPLPGATRRPLIRLGAHVGDLGCGLVTE